ncbi:MAG TPA: toll/interleukin-1 receptor domain-containing protein [Pyrinomonadaceae bacterium]|jgi:hypothetical protein
MKVFISYPRTNIALAQKIVSELDRAGIDVWFDEREILPGDNWARKIAEALEESDAMVVLLTPDAVGRSGHVRSEINFALGNKSFRGRLIPVLVGSPEKFPENSIPWILRHLQMINLPGHGREEEGIQQITQALKEVA